MPHSACCLVPTACWLRATGECLLDDPDDPAAVQPSIPAAYGALALAHGCIAVGACLHPSAEALLWPFRSPGLGAARIAASAAVLSATALVTLADVAALSRSGGDGEELPPRRLLPQLDEQGEELRPFRWLNRAVWPSALARARTPRARARAHAPVRPLMCVWHVHCMPCLQVMLSALSHLLLQGCGLWASVTAEWGAALLTGLGSGLPLLAMAAAQLVHLATIGLCWSQDALWAR